MISSPLPPGDFFKVGGALDPNAPSYVTRQADDDLLQAVLSGQYCNVLTARQMGKSSLMVRTVRRLQGEGIRTVTIDLTGVGTDVSASEWYFGLVSRFKRQLRLSVDVGTWWSERDQLGPVQRFTDFLRQVVLEEIQESIVVFIDEIDSTLNLTFTDDFFAAIRAAYNARATDPVYKRITFVLLGVARPSDLIKDRTRTPYNIGTSVDLTDFMPKEAQVLLAGLETTYPEQAKPILKRVLHWTGGHPYLTQKICAEITTGDDHWTDERIDDLVRQLFLTEEVRKETNLQFIRDRIRESDERGGMLRVYRRVLADKRVEDEERSVAKSQLKLTGLVKATVNSTLVIRNRIYAQTFDKQWVKENMPVSPAQRLAIVASVVAALALVVVGYLIYRQQTRPDEVRAGLYTDNFLSAASPEVRLNNLAGLFGLEGYEDEARTLFFDLETDQQLALFEDLENPPQVGQDALVVVQGMYQDQRLEHSTDQDRILRAMAGVLHQVEGGDVPGAEVTAMEIDYWLAGRERAVEGDFAAAVDQYTLALWLNEENVAILLDRGRTYAALGEYQNALADLQEVIDLNSTWEEAVRRAIEQDFGLFTYVGLHRQEYQAVAAWFPTLTPPPTPTGTPTPIPTSTPSSPLGAGGADWTRSRSTDGMVMVYVPAGEFEMGSDDAIIDYALKLCIEYYGDCERERFEDELPVHPVALDSFWIDQTEATNAQFSTFLNEYGNKPEGGVSWLNLESEDCLITRVGGEYKPKTGFADYPVVLVSWYGAAAYCEWAGGRLPTEAEWEYAARGPEGFVYPWGDEFYCSLGNFDDEAQVDDYVVPGGEGCDGYARIAPVGNFPDGTSWCGALDMAGNVREWVADWYDGSYYRASPLSNPTGPSSGEYRVLRGSSWITGIGYIRVAFRYVGVPDSHADRIGFRCVVPSGQ